MLDKFRKLVPFLFIIFVAVVLFGKTLFPPSGQLLLGWDVNTGEYFSKYYLAENLKKGILPFWNPYSFSGTPFLAGETLYPGNLLFLIFPFGTALSLFYLLHLILGGIFMYRMLVKRTDMTASLLGAIVFAFSGLFAARIMSGHLMYVSSIAYIPLIFGSMTDLIDGFTKKAFLTAVLGLSLQIATGVIFITLLTLELIGLYWFMIYISRLIRKKMTKADLLKLPGLINLKNILMVIILALGLTSFQLIPFFEYSLFNSSRTGGLSFSMASYGAETRETLQLLWEPFSSGSPFLDNFSYHGPWPNYFEYCYYIGKTAFLLAAVYLLWQSISLILRKKTDRLFPFLLFSCLIFLILSLGNNLPFYAVLYHYLPPYEYVRILARHLIIFVFLMSVTASYAAFKIKFRFIKLLILILVTVELISFDRKFLRLYKEPPALEDKNITGYLEKNLHGERILTNYASWSPFKEKYELNNGLVNRIESVGGYNPLIIGDYYRFMELLNGISVSQRDIFASEVPSPNVWSPMIDYLNVKYIVSQYELDKPVQAVKDKLKKVYQGSDYGIFENSHVLPRFYPVVNGELFNSKKDMEDKFLSGKYDLENAIYFLKSDIDKNLSGLNFNCPESKIGSVKTVSYEPNKIVLNTETSCDSWLSTSEVFYPGWRATIDGKEVPIIKANIAFRSLYLPKGKHVVIFQFIPHSFYAGVIISAVSVVFLVLICKKSHKKSPIFSACGR